MKALEFHYGEYRARRRIRGRPYYCPVGPCKIRYMQRWYEYCAETLHFTRTGGNNDVDDLFITYVRMER